MLTIDQLDALADLDTFEMTDEDYAREFAAYAADMDTMPNWVPSEEELVDMAAADGFANPF